MRITISGLSGSGTTTVARLVSKHLGMKMLSAGEIFREIAKENRLSVEDFCRRAENSQDFDRWIDEKQVEEAIKRDNVVVEGRLSGFFIPDADLKVWLKAPLEIRAKRIAHRENITVEEAVSPTKTREQSEYMRYQKYYHLNLDDLSVYDLIIESSKWKENAIVAIIINAVERLDWDSQ
jgi:cytidylate kinase